jgi:hypothetical protein
MTPQRRRTINRSFAYAHALARAAIGLQITLAPQRSIGRRWFGDYSEDGATRIAMRGMGARELALGVALIHELTRGSSARTLFAICATAESVDVLGSLLGPAHFRHRPATHVTMLATAAVLSASYLAGKHDA